MPWGLNFGFISCSAGMSESQLLGRMVPTGAQGQFEFLGTQFLDCFENGGVFLFDELDAADSNVLLVINAALAMAGWPFLRDTTSRRRKGTLISSVSQRPIRLDAGLIVSTSARNELDESTMDRFPNRHRAQWNTTPSLSVSSALIPNCIKRLQGYRERVVVESS